MVDRLRIIVGGLLGRTPVGGWHYLHYVVGLSRLGHDVYYHEDTWCWPYHPLEKTFTSAGEYSARYIGDFFEQYAPELRRRWHYRHLHERSFGIDQTAFDEIARTTDLFLNVGGACIIPEQVSSQCVKVFLDTDPGYNQIVLSERCAWSENVHRWCASVASHDQHFTYAENIHSPECLIPKMAFQWKTTRPPVVLDLWEPIARARPPAAAPWTTIMTWNAFQGKLIYQGVEYKSKDGEFEKLIQLPRRVSIPFRLAVGGATAPLERLASYGWQVVDGPSTTLTPARYQDFIADSRGELSAAKHVYVAMRSGWFSERSGCYLASGRPVVVQDTGFGSALPVGEGIWPFRTLEEAVAVIREVEGDYPRQTKAARAVAEECFDSEKVLSRLIEKVANL